jgi:hypothetical protein
MSVITPRALALLDRVKGDNEMIYVRIKDNLGFEFEGRILEVDGDHFDIEATDGEQVYNCRIDRVMTVDVRPLRRFTAYTVAHFADEFGPGVS